MGEFLNLEEPKLKTFGNLICLEVDDENPIRSISKGMLI